MEQKNRGLIPAMLAMASYTSLKNMTLSVYSRNSVSLVYMILYAADKNVTLFLIRK